MITSMSAFGKASASGSRELPLTRLKCYVPLRYSSAASSTFKAQVNGTANTPAKQQDSVVQRDLFFNVLNAHATKRDAKQYLARFKSPKPSSPDESPALSPLQQERNARHLQDQDRLDRAGVNLGGLYAPARAIAEAAQFIRGDVDQQSRLIPEESIHVALVCLRQPHTLDDSILDGVALTLSQLVKLDMKIAVVLDAAGPLPQAEEAGVRSISKEAAHQAARLSRAIGRHSTTGARYTPGTMEVRANEAISGRMGTPDHSAAVVTVPSLILEPLRRSVVPILPALAYGPGGQLKAISAKSAMQAATRLLSGLPLGASSDRQSSGSVTTSLDRIIVLDTAGGIPSKARNDGAHVFINLEQEYTDIQAELTQFLPDEAERHQHNLTILRDCLALLPSASSALIITPQEAAASSSQLPEQTSTGAGTRRQKNTLIHNLLTNRPMISSSLPVARIPSGVGSTHFVTPRATLIKRGMPVTIIPAADPNIGWLPPESGRTSLDLKMDPRVDLPRLVHLIEDSFRRKLDVAHYLNRIRGRTAGLIVAGEYEGGAILTWETPPDAPEDDPTRLVPYLDKFAVLSSSQGSSGVADIVFQSMVRTCFPQGVCWRSRRDNPVNKWYFERSEGTWRVPDSGWMMFWTGSGVEGDEQKWEDYVAVCKSIGPSWADGKTRLD